MEDVEYNMAKRYSDLIKTMWFTFFYAPAIPIGIVFSIVGLFLYYWIDKAKKKLNASFFIYFLFSTMFIREEQLRRVFP